MYAMRAMQAIVWSECTHRKGLGQEAVEILAFGNPGLELGRLLPQLLVAERCDGWFELVDCIHARLVLLSRRLRWIAFEQAKDG